VGGLLEHETKAARAAVLDRECLQTKVLVLDKVTGFDREQVNLEWGFGPAQHYPKEQVVNPLQRPGTRPDLQFIHGLPAGKGGEQTGQPENMIEVAVGNQYPIEPPKTHPGPQNLPLGAFATIDQEAVISKTYDLRAKAAVNGWSGGRGSEE
jgi:hypothetical protein